ncbi:MAG TPA: MerR family transcriptional regulator [Gemmatimonadales bacterium]|nr:MerR family transcriptional regulator [Gemmatimonadales bacterium]
MPERTYEIHEVAELTGLQPSRLRVWERRYAAVRPVRQANGYRAYSAEQVALLRAYARLIAGGARIGDLVEEPVEAVVARAEGRDPSSAPHAALLDAVKAFDRDRLEALVAQQLALRSLGEFATLVALPLARDIGDLWALGRLPIAAGHLASEVVVHALRTGLRGGKGPLVLAACLAGERHEWGVLAALAEVHERGWRVTYLGPDLPVPELAEAAWRIRPAAVAVSASDPALVRRQLSQLGELPLRLPPGAVPVAGGSGIEPHARLLRTHGYRIGLEGFGEAGSV